jgi:hypothetical protein
MTLKRCSEMNLLNRPLIGRKRYEYTLAPGGERRLKYKRNSYSGFSEKKEQSPANGVFEELEEFGGFMAFKTIFESRDPAWRAFANYLRLQFLNGASRGQLLHDA